MITTTLAYFPSPAQGVWHLGFIPIRAYALFIILGIFAALAIGDRRWAARGGERGVIYDIALWAVPFGLLGGRLYHVMTDWKTYFGPEGLGPLAALKVWDGGLGIWGAVALGGVGAWIGCRHRGIPLPAFGDAVAPGIVLAQAIGRIGNYFNQELYGRETTVPWGMEIFYRRDPSGILDVNSLNGVSTGQVAAVVHPTFLYELLWNLLVFVALIYIDRRFKIGHGRLFALYVAGYCVGRFCVELLRDDVATHIAGIRINSFTATFVFIGAIVYFILAPKGREDPATLGGNEDEESVVDELVDELVDGLTAAAATTGVVAAATVAGKEDEPAPDDAAADDAAPEKAEPQREPEPQPEPEPEPEPQPEPEPEPVAVDEPEAVVVEVADPAPESDAAESVVEEPAVEETGPESASAVDGEPDAEPEPVVETETVAPEPGGDADDSRGADDVGDSAPDEAVVEAEAAAAGLETETAAETVDAEPEDDEDEDDDEDDEAEGDLEGAEEVSSQGGPVSEQQEELDNEAEDEADLDDESEDELAVESDVAEPDDESEVEPQGDDVAPEQAAVAEDASVEVAEDATAEVTEEATAEAIEEPAVRGSVWSRLRRR